MVCVNVVVLLRIEDTIKSKIEKIRQTKEK